MCHKTYAVMRLLRLYNSPEDCYFFYSAFFSFYRSQVLLNTLEGMLCIDPNSVHVTGQSDGAMMAISLGLSLPQRITSVVAVSAAPLAGAHLDLLATVKNVSIMSLRGDLDKVCALRCERYG